MFVIRASPARLTHAGQAPLRLAQRVDILFQDAIQSLNDDDAAPPLAVVLNHVGE